MDEWFVALAVALAGGCGALARHGCDRLATAYLGAGQVWGTFAVNALGSFALGLLVGLSPGGAWLDVAGIGFLGGYTTFSTAMLQAVQSAGDRGFVRAGLLAASMAVLCVAAATAGVLLT